MSPLAIRLADWKILLARGATGGARLDAASVQDLIGTLTACEVKLGYLGTSTAPVVIDVTDYREVRP